MTSEKRIGSPTPHGGAQELVDLHMSEEEARDFLGRASELRRYRISDADLSTLYRLGDGTLTPVDGPMGQEEFGRVLDEEVIVRDGVKCAWTIPVIFPATDDEVSSYEVGRLIAIESEAGEVVGSLYLKEIYPLDKMRYIERVYGTSRTDHP